MAIDKDHPSAEWIADLKKRFPTEKEMDHVLTSKLQRRAGPPYTPISLETMGESLRKLLLSSLEGPFNIHDLRWLSGGASKVQVAFKLDWQRPGSGSVTMPMIIRMEPAESIVETSRLREFQVLKAIQGVLPVPEVYWIDADGKYFPYPALVCGFVDGVTKPKGVVSNVSGLGTNFGSTALRETLGKQFVDHLAKLHTWKWQDAHDLSAFDVPSTGPRAFEDHFNWMQRVWEEDSNRDIPLMRLTAQWLRDNMPPIDRLSMIHADFRSGNFLFTERDQRISAWLDWELAHLGDFHEDVAYATLPTWSHYSEDGSVFLANGMMPASALYEAYEKATGFKVDKKKIDYYEVFHTWRTAIFVIATGYRAARNGKTHQDVLMSWIMGMGYVLLGSLHKKLEEIG